jgi:hypothetical protein
MGPFISTSTEGPATASAQSAWTPLSACDAVLAALRLIPSEGGAALTRVVAVARPGALGQLGKARVVPTVPVKAHTLTFPLRAYQSQRGSPGLQG